VRRCKRDCGSSPQPLECSTHRNRIFPLNVQFQQSSTNSIPTNISLILNPVTPDLDHKILTQGLTLPAGLRKPVVARQLADNLHAATRCHTPPAKAAVPVRRKRQPEQNPLASAQINCHPTSWSTTWCKITVSASRRNAPGVQTRCASSSGTI
jgi:hypothetical protein